MHQQGRGVKAGRGVKVGTRRMPTERDISCKIKKSLETLSGPEGAGLPNPATGLRRSCFTKDEGCFFVSSKEAT